MNEYAGLSESEVKTRVKQGQVNGVTTVKTKSIKQILFTNIFTLFNFVSIALATGLFLVHSTKNMMFMMVVFFNTMIGIIQEIRAKRVIDKLSIIAAPVANVIRNGKETKIASEEIVLDDIYVLENGKQVCSDSIILDGVCEVNESLLSGETMPVVKKKGDEVLSGSYIISGRVIAQVIHIADNNYASIITKKAKYLKRTSSEIYNSVKKLVKYVTISIAPVYAIMFIKQYFIADASIRDTVISTTASVIGMIPSGLILLVSIVMAVSVVRLASCKTLVQDMYSIETLARVDVLCLDKTGTITEGRMDVDDVIILDEELDKDHIDYMISEYIHASVENNATYLALKDRYESLYSKYEKHLQVEDVVSFSSERKYGSISFVGEGKYILGAPEYVVNNLDNSTAIMAKEYEEKGKRVVLFAHSDENATPKAIALIVISDVIRKNANSTLDFFAMQGVDIKIISGDNPVMVSKIAKSAGLSTYESYVDATTLSDDMIDGATQKYSIFGRVTPEQKLMIIKSLKKHGHTVAMTGDGVNDVLALKESDCSIAMQSGSDAARNVSNFVLLDSDFSSLPLILREGRRNINNLERSASLFLTKTTYSILLTLAFLILPLNYPFQPIQFTLISAFAIGIPSFLLNIEKNDNIVEKNFLKRVLKTAVPAGITVLFAVMSAEFFGYLTELSTNDIKTMAVYGLAIASLVELFRICRPLNRFRKILITVITIILELIAIIFKEFFSLQQINKKMLIFIISALVIIFLIRNIYYKKKKAV